MKKSNPIYDLYIKHVEGTVIKQKVPNEKVFVGKVNKEAATGAKLKARKIYISARVVKKLYDIRNVENPDEFVYIINNLKKIVVYPDKIYKNKPLKRGSHILVRKNRSHYYLCLIQLRPNKKQFEVVTVFPTGLKDSYLDGFNLMWS